MSLVSSLCHTVEDWQMLLRTFLSPGHQENTFYDDTRSPPPPEKGKLFFAATKPVSIFLS